ncbi:hypothetical protein [Serratia sp. 2723]|uniref:hypothetical protein n=1 Tax=unclassified Serratia (in: enterobacteria) TaxID=2647522 RepID=UPI003D239B73
MDIFYILHFAWLNITHGRVPLYDDIVELSRYLPEQGWYRIAIIVIFSLSLLLTVSIAFSAFFFLARYPIATTLAYVQIPARLLLIVPSLSFLPWLVKTLGVNPDVLGIGVVLVLISEALKIWTLNRK